MILMCPMRAAMRCVVVVLAMCPGLREASDGQKRPVCPQHSSCVYDKDSYVKDTFFYDLNGSELLQVKYEPQIKYFLWCRNGNTSVDNPELPALTELDEVETVEIYNCLAPSNTSYYDALKAWNITVTKTLLLSAQHASPTLKERHLSGLQIQELSIIAGDNNDLPRPSQDFLSGLKAGLRILTLKGVIPEARAFMQLPLTLETIDLMYAKVPAAVSQLGIGSAWLERLHSLKSLSLLESHFGVADPLTFPQFNLSLHNLTNLSLTDIPLNTSSLAGKLNGSSIQILKLYSCGLNNLPDTLFEGANLTQLVINGHNLSVPRGLFLPLQWLTEVDLSHNNLDSATLIDAVSSLPSLQRLVANNNPLGSLCGDANTNSPGAKWPKSLQHLDLTETNATRICPDWVENDSLMNIILKNNDIGDLTYTDLKMKRAMVMESTSMPVTLDLLNNPNLRFVNVSTADVLQCRNDSTSLKDSSNRTRVKVKLNIKRNDVKCDYGLYWLGEILHECLLWLVPGDDYNSGDGLCPYSGYCLPECTCNKRPRDNATVVNCTGLLPRVPHWPPSAPGFPMALHVKSSTLTAVPSNVTLAELHAPNNNISRLDVWDIDDALIELDVRNNSIRQISVEAARKLNAKGTKRAVYLKGNSLDCTCSDAPAYELLASNNVVLDWNETLCADNIYVSEKMQSGLCFPVQHLILVAVGIGMPLLTIGLLLNIYKLQLRQLLFKLNCCRRYIFRVNDDSTEKEKDIFLSYFHKDLDQMKIIKNALEDFGYTTIEHSRDFEPGDPILSQIENSVQKARRTLVLVSNNFIRSRWMPYEFRYAHSHALKHQTSKVVVIRYELSQETERMLPADLRFYIKYHTYLDWNDDNFWKKIRDALGTPRFQLVDHNLEI